MIGRFDPKTLFEAKRRIPFPTLYKRTDAELDAVKARRKGISSTGYPAEFIRRADPSVIEFLNKAIDRGLAIVMQPDSRGGIDDAVSVFALHLDQAWRIPALAALWETAFVDGSWTHAAEVQLSVLLGYSREQTRGWLAYVRARQPAWGHTVYALLTAAQKRATVALGRRCFGGTNDLTLFSHSHGHSLKKNVLRLVPKGLTLARVAVLWPDYQAMFGKPGRPRIDALVLTERIAPRLYAALRSNVQFLGRRGWT